MFSNVRVVGRSMIAMAAVAFLAACGEAPSAPTSADNGVAVADAPLANNVTNQSYVSGSTPVTAYDPIIPAFADPTWPTTKCTTVPAVGLNANWVNPHPAFTGFWHPWIGSLFSAGWINAWSDISSRGPSGQSWTKYTTQIAGNGSFVIKLLADNCSWVYLDGTLVGVQPAQWNAANTQYGLTLNGTHTLTFIIFDGGGAAGGKFLLATTTNPPPPLNPDLDGDGHPNTTDKFPLDPTEWADTDGDGVGDNADPVDSTPPSITPTVTGTLGTNGWYTSNIGISWAVNDAQSAVSASTGCGATSVTTDTNGMTYTCSATSAGGSASASVTVKRDATTPVIAFSGNAGTYGVHQNVNITCSASDAMSGIAGSNCPGASGAGYTFAVGANTLNASATDNAGNASTASATFSIVVRSGDICTLVQAWVANKGVANSFCKQLEHQSYDAFRNHMSAQSGKHITAERAAILIALSRSL